MSKNCISFIHNFFGIVTTQEEENDEINIPNTPRTELTDQQIRQRNESFDNKYDSIHIYTNPEERDECAICIEPINNGDVCKILNCKHVYHINCIKKWVIFKNKQTCPTCNAFINGMNESILKKY